MHRKVEDKAVEVKAAPSPNTLVSASPATGAEIWSSAIGTATAEVAAARAAWPEWAAHSVTYRMETLRRFANVVRAREGEFAELIARETGKPYLGACW